MSEFKKVNGVPENETFWQKCRRKAETAVNWGKTHWKGIAIGAVALGGGAYMLSRRGERDGDTNREERSSSGPIDYRREIEQAFEPGDEDPEEVGPEDDEPEED